MSKHSKWLMFILVSIFYAYQYVLRVMPSIMLEDIIDQFSIQPSSFGQFSGIYYIGYSLMHLPLGIMFDRFGPRKVLTICIIIASLGSLPIIYTDIWIYPIIGRFLVGAASSAAILGGFKIIRMSFNEDRFTRMLTILVSIGLIGAIYGGGPVEYMCQIFGYISVIHILAISGCVLAILTYIIIPNTESKTSSSISSDLKLVLTNKKVILGCIFAGMMVGPLEGFADVWGSVFFKRIYGLDNYIAASLPSTIFIGMCFGAPFLGLFAEQTKSYLGTIIGSGILMASIFAILIMSKISVSVISISFIILGICCAYQIIAIYYVSTCVPENVVGLTNALANMVIMSFGYIFHVLIGTIVTNMGGIHNPDALIFGISVIPTFLIFGSLGFIWLALTSKKAEN